MKRGEVMLNRRGQYCLREQIAGLVVGTVQGARNGDGQLLPDDGSAAIYLPAAQMREVMHGDRLAVRIEATRFRGKAQGTIVEVLERRTKEVVGRLHIESGVAYLTPDNPRIPHRVLVPSQQLGAAVDGQIVMVELTHQPSRTSGPVGRVARILGDHGAPGMETEIAIHSHGLPYEFPARGRGRGRQRSAPAFRRTRSPGAKTCAAWNSSRSTARTRAISTMRSGASARAAAGA